MENIVNVEGTEIEYRILRASERVLLFLCCEPMFCMI